MVGCPQDRGGVALQVAARIEQTCKNILGPNSEAREHAGFVFVWGGEPPNLLGWTGSKAHPNHQPKPEEFLNRRILLSVVKRCHEQF